MTLPLPLDDKSDRPCSIREAKRNAGPEPWMRWIMGDNACKPWEPPTFPCEELDLCEKHMIEANKLGMPALRRKYRIA